jgi:hypothetical protein
MSNAENSRDLTEMDARLTGKLSDIRLSVALEVERVNGVIRSRRIVANVIWAVLGICVLAMGSAVGHATERSKALGDSIVNIDKDLIEIKGSIKELRQRINRGDK